jgi:hypothetical protein
VSLRRPSAARGALHEAAVALCVAALLAGCGGGQAPPPQTLRESPAEGILRIGRVWQARESETGFMSAPSPIATFQSDVVSHLTLAAQGPAREKLEYSERFSLRDGRVANCATTLEQEVRLAYGLKGGVPAIELEWPQARPSRACDLPGFSAPVLERRAGRARFVLRDDRLVGVEPPGEKRSFIPVE